MIKRRRRKGFLEDFRLSETYLVKPDRKLGRPGILEGEDGQGNSVLIKIWPVVAKGDDEDLREIWHHELRQLHRLSGYPAAADYIVGLRQSHMDDSGFYLVLDPGQRRSLRTLLDTASANHWIRQYRLPGIRRRIWHNLRRLALGLDCLHSQGLLHRNLDAWAVLTSGGEEPDFQLTGFEWSMRLMAAASDPAFRRRSVRELDQQFDSFANDWAMLGILACELVGAPTEKVFDPAFAPGEVAEHLGADEARLLRNLIGAELLPRLDGDVVAERIDEVIGSLSAEAAGVAPKLHLVVRVGAGTAVADRIVASTGGAVDGAADQEQVDFIRNDIAADALLMAVRLSPGSDEFRLVLRGHSLCYAVQQYRHPKAVEASWEFAFVGGVEKAPPVPSNILGQISFPVNGVEVLSTVDANEKFPRMRGKVRGWEDLRNELQGIQKPLSDLDYFHKALVLTQFLETLYAAADVFPVEIVPARGGEASTKGDETFLKVRLRRDEGRDNLSKALNLKPPATRLNDALDGESVRIDGWFLTDSRHLGERNPTDTEWQFEQVEQPGDGPPMYVFRGTSPVPFLRDPFLVPDSSVGRDSQFRRRLKALRALKDHVELLRMLVRPRARILDSHDVVEEDERFKDLDEPKQRAFREAVSTIPIYLVQGPPGVGKTRLVRDLVQDRFSRDRTTRLLLTAQSNHAVDHLMGELAEALKGGGNPAPLVVRCVPREAAAEAGEFAVSARADELLGMLASSALAQTAPLPIREKVAACQRGSPTGRDSGKRAFEALVMRAANVVFATTNSGDLERLIEERAQFDWSIIEEAGKATGCELVSPLLLSHRRLMIGDHKQLPPYGAEDIRGLLEAPDQVRQALEAGAEFIGRSLKDSDTEEVLGEIDEGTMELAPLCAQAIRVLMLFETLIVDELDRPRRSAEEKPIAKQLTAQHRMHPEIANIVSHAFYDGKLKTDERAQVRYQSTAPVRSKDAKRLPNAPIVFVDMPYLQSTIKKKKGEELPRWRNREEVGAVLSVLKQLEVQPGLDKRPSLVVLSPYAQQVRLLQHEIEKAEERGELDLSQFRSATRSNGFCATADSFQGNEADVVVISLVRNNDHIRPRKALGFLSDPRRMNVLVSRAKWRMVLVGSREFLDTVLKANTTPEHRKALAALDRLLNALDAGRKTGGVGVQTLDGLRGGGA